MVRSIPHQDNPQGNVGECYLAQGRKRRQLADRTGPDDTPIPNSPFVPSPFLFRV